ncbi:ABC transporter substrate-binding protein [Paenibacillus sp. SYP-B4298]|uniref:ABC transporter substrate-binding protein n=1 Tax=Paenibacillus sp. SYP-B4298 TaxID=2996034 RepID=UPI0022DE219D|nr:extracellular solute-binding protein [Paenibacillus sp. SYP-B4298]
MKNYVGNHALLLAVSMSLIAGCSGGNTTNTEERSMLKIHSLNEEAFHYGYGMLYSALHPNVDFEVIETQDLLLNADNEDRKAAFQKMIEEEQPDVLFLSLEEYNLFSQQGKLLDLTPFIEQDKYNTDNFVPGMLEYLKEQGGGTLYGLSPSFYSQAVFYNKDLFEKYGVELPTDRMSWDDVMARASRFPTDGTPEERIYGLKSDFSANLFDLATSIGDTHGLSMFNSDTMQTTLDTPAWHNVFSNALDAIRSGTIYVKDENRMPNWDSYEGFLMSDPFVSGRAAMMIEEAYIVDQLKASAEYLKDKVSFDWDLVTVPIDPANPDYTTTTSVDQILAINANSTNSKEAWNFMKYILSDEFARVTSKSYNDAMAISVRTGYFKDDEGRNLDAFYALKPSLAPSRLYNSKLPSGFYDEFRALANSKLEPVVKDNASLETTLKELQQEGQQLLMKAKQEEDGKKSEDGKPDENQPESTDEADQNESEAAAEVAS